MENSNRTIIDVRSEGEYASGHAESAMNIPLNELDARVDEIKNIEGEIILCCASGTRSGMAQQILETKGVKCHNAGAWFAAENYALDL